MFEKENASARVGGYSYVRMRRCVLADETKTARAALWENGKEKEKEKEKEIEKEKEKEKESQERGGEEKREKARSQIGRAVAAEAQPRPARSRPVILRRALALLVSPGRDARPQLRRPVRSAGWGVSSGRRRERVGKAGPQPSKGAFPCISSRSIRVR